MSFVAIMILSTLMLLLQGHVVCLNFTLTGIQHIVRMWYCIADSISLFFLKESSVYNSKADVAKKRVSFTFPEDIDTVSISKCMDYVLLKRQFHMSGLLKVYGILQYTCHHRHPLFTLFRYMYKEKMKYSYTRNYREQNSRDYNN